MAPFPAIAAALLQKLASNSQSNSTTSSSNSSSVISSLRSQWSNPGDILSLLLIIGGDVIQKSLGQLSGHVLTPVTFSFGWVAYAYSVLLAVFGNQKLMPEADYSAEIINCDTGYKRSNESWVLGRIVRDIEYWLDAEPKREVEALLVSENEKRKHQGRGPVSKIGLCVSIYSSIKPFKQGKPAYDHLWVIGLVVTVIQLGIAAIPWGINGEWVALLITAAGSLLAYITGALPQWTLEKWSCRKSSTKTCALTHGDGSQHVIVIQGNSIGLDLKDLAASEGTKWRFTSISLVILAVFWTALLITVSGLQEHTWYLVAIGALGMIQNIYVAGAKRRPNAFGVHIQYDKHFFFPKVMRTLMETEIEYPGVGKSLVETFFPGSLRDDEITFWNELVTPEARREWIRKKDEERLLKGRKSTREGGFDGAGVERAEVNALPPKK
ncbi:MAG: hypothetical protein M1834_009687 [Cirrosporium novae-zelandiae]|nr:MAG: hypothetical protein M1834_009687 [Cirrosporium novae-zelandiae]